MRTCAYTHAHVRVYRSVVGESAKRKTQVRMLSRVPTYLLTYVPTYLLTYVLTYLQVRMLSRVPALEDRLEKKYGKTWSSVRQLEFSHRELTELKR